MYHYLITYRDMINYDVWMIHLFRSKILFDKYYFKYMEDEINHLAFNHDKSNNDAGLHYCTNKYIIFDD